MQERILPEILGKLKYLCHMGVMGHYYPCVEIKGTPRDLQGQRKKIFPAIREKVFKLGHKGNNAPLLSRDLRNPCLGYLSLCIKGSDLIRGLLHLVPKGLYPDRENPGLLKRYHRVSHIAGIHGTDVGRQAFDLMPAGRHGDYGERSAAGLSGGLAFSDVQ